MGWHRRVRSEAGSALVTFEPTKAEPILHRDKKSHQPECVWKPDSVVRHQTSTPNQDHGLNQPKMNF
ncbi:MAG: hypothetical protein CMO55_23280 [Verrucomicrobiales bacterium]|nr:hypothetical protein [Verrucomicrobiales bacterium]